MYTLSDLSSMDLPELKAIAMSMEINKIDDLSQNDLVYAILDQQAINTSKASTANMSERKKKSPKPKAKAKKAADNKEVVAADNNGAALQPTKKAGKNNGIYNF